MPAPEQFMLQTWTVVAQHGPDHLPAQVFSLARARSSAHGLAIQAAAAKIGAGPAPSVRMLEERGEGKGEDGRGGDEGMERT